MDPTTGVIYSHFTDRLFPFVVTASGTGAGVAVLAGTGSYIGQAEITSGTDADGKANIGSAMNALTFSGGLWTWEALVQIPVLSDGTNSFKFHGGFFNGTNGGDESAFIKYIHSYESGQFTCQTVHGEGAANTYASGITVAAGQWYKLKIVADMSVPSIKYYIDGALITTFTANLPVGSTTGCGVLMTKTLGTTARTILCDWQKVTCPRAAIESAQSGYWDADATWLGGVAPANLDGVRIKATHDVTIRTAVTVNQPDSSKAPFQIENGGRLLVGPTGAGSLTATQGTRLVIDGDIDVWTWAKFGPIFQAEFCEGRMRRMVPQARIIMGDDGFEYGG